jgi:L-seryl-tRNA(Ser) seleniumtransferase
MKQNPSGKRALPAVGKLLETPQVQTVLQEIPRALMVESLREEIALERARISSGALPSPVQKLIDQAIARARSADSASLQPAVNATGTILHTGLGRAALSEAAREAILQTAFGHCTLEVDVFTGRRGSRQDHVRGLLCELTGAQSALVVNNNAGATVLAIMAIAAGKEVIISRGELIEIGGSFRLPEIIRVSGAKLVEVGTTNRTRLSDYAQAITAETGLLLKCHPSNFKIIGFTEETSTAELTVLGRERGIPVMDDLGSGAILAPEQPGISRPVTLSMAVASGCDLVTASGDKLLGGPQAGIILGKKDVIELIGRHPLARALRVDKLTLAALEATLRLYRDPSRAAREIPTLRYLYRTESSLKKMAQRLKRRIESVCPRIFHLDIISSFSQVGGGSLPGEQLPTWCVRLKMADGSISEEEIACSLRKNRPSVFARIEGDALLFDPRTLEEQELQTIALALSSLAKESDNR